MQPIKLIVGLKNPGGEYAKTRHNAGAWWVDAIASKNHLKFKKHNKALAEIAMPAENNLILAQPSTYMNQSGMAVKALADYYKLDPAQILIVHDELDLPVGKLKLKTGGGHGGHNGLKDIIAHLHSNDFHRLRIGIGHPGDRNKVLDYVLHQPSKIDMTTILTNIAASLAVLPLLQIGDIAKAMTFINTEF